METTAQPHNPAVWRRPTRILITVATTNYPGRDDADQRPELIHDLQRIERTLAAPEFGYTRMPLLDDRSGQDVSINPSREQLRSGLRQLVSDPSRHPDDMVVIYYAGHGDCIDPNDYRLLLNASDQADPEPTASGADLAEWLTKDSNINNLMLILDTCYSGAGASEIVARMSRHNAASVTVCAARAFEEASTGFFSKAFCRALKAQSIAGYGPRMLPIEEIIRVINADPERPRWQTAIVHMVGMSSGQPSFFPNPRHVENTAISTERATWYEGLRQHVVSGHVIPRARGIHPEDVWLFTGRHNALSLLCNWLSDPLQGPAIVVTGDPGSGKSAVLARLYALSDRDLRAQIPGIANLPPTTVPAIGAITDFVLASGMSSRNLLHAISAACKITDADSADELIERIWSRSIACTVVIDALDELSATGTSGEPGEDYLALHSLLLPLIRASQRGLPLRLLIGMRKRVPSALSDITTMVDLDDDAERVASRADITEYARLCLLHISECSPYRGRQASYIDDICAAISHAAGNSFLVAQIVARTLANQSTSADPNDNAWRESLPRVASEAMRMDLQSRLGDSADTAERLLLPLAYAEGRGLPWEAIWPALSNAMSGSSYRSEDLRWLMDKVGYYVSEYCPDETHSYYRIYHTSLAEYLRRDRDKTADQRLVVNTALATVVPGLNGGWEHAHPYWLSYLARHAVAGGVLDDLLENAGYLSSADPGELSTTLHHAKSAHARDIRTVYLASLQYHRTTNVESRRRILAIDAAKVGQVALLRNLNEGLAWKIRWAVGSALSASRHSVIRASGVAACAQLDSRPVVVSCGGMGELHQGLEVWDLESSTRVLAFPRTGAGMVTNDVAVAQVNGASLVAAVTGDYLYELPGFLWLYDLGQREMRRIAGMEDAFMLSVAMTDITGESLVLVGDSVGRLSVRKAQGDELLFVLFNDEAVMGIACGYVGQTPVAVTVGGPAGKISVWNLRQGKRWFTLRSGIPLHSVALEVHQGETFLVTGGKSGSVKLWNLTTRKLIRNFSIHDDLEVQSIALFVREPKLYALAGTGKRWDIGNLMHDVKGELTLLDLESGAVIQRYPAEELGVASVALGKIHDTLIAVVGTPATSDIVTWKIDIDVLRPRELGLSTRRAICDVVPLVTNSEALVACLDLDGQVDIRQAESGRLVWSPRTNAAVRAIASSRFGDSEILVTGDASGYLCFWDPWRQAMLAKVRGHRASIDNIKTVQFNLGPAVVSASSSGGNEVKVWLTADVIRRSLSAARPRWATRMKHSVGVLAAGEENGRICVVVGTKGSFPWQRAIMAIWHPESGRVSACEVGGYGVELLAVGRREGELFAILTTNLGGDEAGDLALIDLETPSVVWDSMLPLNRDAPSVMALTRVGAQPVTRMGQGRYIVTFELTAGKVVSEHAFARNVDALAMAGQGQMVVALGFDLVFVDSTGASAHSE
ncbi:caspase family protein [Catellatospora sichuanensis]|uniref:caspase family protein n=1 Tax=Catellatospora sichuanensis TaxID=1969805 RepID=UPI001642462D|nr:caspase family protein [Catellatospora sichuanensis]